MFVMILLPSFLHFVLFVHFVLLLLSPLFLLFLLFLSVLSSLSFPSLCSFLPFSLSTPPPSPSPFCFFFLLVIPCAAVPLLFSAITLLLLRTPENLDMEIARLRTMTNKVPRIPKELHLVSLLLSHTLRSQHCQAVWSQSHDFG